MSRRRRQERRWRKRTRRMPVARALTLAEELALRDVERRLAEYDGDRAEAGFLQLLLECRLHTVERLMSARVDDLSDEIAMQLFAEDDNKRA